jgi:hypothetical protein
LKFVNKNILVLVCGRVIGGHEIQLKTILQDLCAMRDNVVILCQTAATHAYFASLPCQVQHVDFGVEGKVWRQWQAARGIATTLAGNFSSAQSILVSGGTIEACIGAARAAKLSQPDVKVIAYLPMYIDRSHSHGLVGRVYDLVVNRMARTVDEYLTINRIQARLIRSYYRRPVSVVENAIQAVRAPASSKGKRLVFLGRFDDGQKGLLELITLLDRPDNPYAEVIFIGDGPDSEAIVAKSRSTRDITVHFGPWMPVSGVDDFLGTHDCLIMNSRWEGEPLVVREFTARGLPCVVRDITGMRGVTSRAMRFTDGDSLIGILKKLHGAESTRNYVHAARVPQSRRLQILASLFETRNSH